MTDANTVNLWFTYYSAGSLHAGGLERVDVWFQQPQYVYLQTWRTWEDADMPFGVGHQREGVQKHGWRVIHTDYKYQESSISLGKTFGYDSDVSLKVWEALCEHFGSEELRDWYLIEKEGKALPENFCLKMSVKFELGT